MNHKKTRIAIAMLTAFNALTGIGGDIALPAGDFPDFGALFLERKNLFKQLREDVFTISVSAG